MVRRLIALLVLSLAGAAAFGLSNASSGISVSGAGVTGSTFRSELAAIAATPTIECYLTGLAPANFTRGAGGATLAASGAAAWSNLRIEGIAIGQFVRRQWKYQPDARALAVATSSLEGEMTQAAAANQLNCPGTSAQALAEMPAEMRNAEIEAQAASLYLVSKLNSTIPLTTASMRAYYASHASSYDTICISVALVTPAQVAAFSNAQASGKSVAALARQFSVDSSAKNGGAYGCFAPSSSSYASVRADVVTTALNSFPTTPQSVVLSGTTYALYVAPTKRTTTPFAQAASMVLADLRNANASSANTVKEKILYQAAVAVDPAFGRWGLGTNGPTVFAPATPAAADVKSAAALSTASASTYK